MTVYCCAALGPNQSYFFNSPTKWSRSGLPAAVNELFTQAQPIKEVHDLALGPVPGSFVMTYTKANGTRSCFRNGIPDSLDSWLVKNNSVVRDLTSLSVVLGPNQAYFAYDQNGSAWGNLPDQLDGVIAKRRDSKGHWLPGKGPASVALGPNGSFVFIDVSGGGSWSGNLETEAPDLRTYLKSLTTPAPLKNIYCIMSPAEQNTWILVSAHGNSNAFLASGAHEHYNAFAENWRQAVQKTPRPVAVAQARAPATASRSTVNMRNVNSGLKLLNSGLKLMNALNGNGGGGGGGGFSYGGDTTTYVPDTSSFWQPIQSAAQDPIQ